MNKNRNPKNQIRPDFNISGLRGNNPVDRDSSPEWAIRYAQQILIDKVGVEGQSRLESSRVLIVGAGGLGGIVASYLVAAGVGTVGIADGNSVELANLHRQVVYSTEHVGSSKVNVLSTRLRNANPAVDIYTYDRLDESNADGMIKTFGLVLDCSDNYPTRFLVNETCKRRGKTLVSAAIEDFNGQLGVFEPSGPCYQCLICEPPDPRVALCRVGTKALGPLSGLIGSWQALEAMRQVIGLPGRLTGCMLLFDGLTNDIQIIRLRKDPQCPVCSKMNVQLSG